MEEDPLKPKKIRTCYSFFVQTVGDQIRNNHPDGPDSFSQFLTTCAERWKILSSEEKKRFIDMSGEDVFRYQREIENYKPPPPKPQTMELRSHCKERINTSTQLEKKKPSNDLDHPRKPVCAFLYFSAEVFFKVRNKNPELSFGRRAKKIAEMWRNLSAEDRQPYQEAAEKSKERYIKEMIEYRKKNGDLPSSAVTHDEEGEGEGIVNE